MTEERQPGHLWALIQEWMDSLRYPVSQRQLAGHLHVSPTTISDWKYGTGFPAPERLHDLAAEIGVPYERVLDAVLKDRGYRKADASHEQRRGTA